MSMLAERRRKTKWTLNPCRRSLWNADPSRGITFGKELMEKFGWQVGRGLGANEQGNPLPMSVALKTDTKGLGFQDKDDEWIQNQEDFNQLLSKLSCDGGADADGNLPPGKEQSKVQSLEEKSKLSKARVHYHKFTRGKDLSKYSEKDLECILGSSKTVVTDCKEDGTETYDKDNGCEEPNDFTSVNALTVEEYFAMKLKKKKGCDANVTSAENESKAIENGEPGEVNEDHSAGNWVGLDEGTEVDGGRKCRRKKKKGENVNGDCLNCDKKMNAGDGNGIWVGCSDENGERVTEDFQNYDGMEKDGGEGYAETTSHAGETNRQLEKCTDADAGVDENDGGRRLKKKKKKKEKYSAEDNCDVRECAGVGVSREGKKNKEKDLLMNSAEDGEGSNFECLNGVSNKREASECYLDGEGKPEGCEEGKKKNKKRTFAAENNSVVAHETESVVEEQEVENVKKKKENCSLGSNSENVEVHGFHKKKKKDKRKGLPEDVPPVHEENETEKAGEPATVEQHKKKGTKKDYSDDCRVDEHQVTEQTEKRKKRKGKCCEERSSPDNEEVDKKRRKKRKEKHSSEDVAPELEMEPVNTEGSPEVHPQSFPNESNVGEELKEGRKKKKKKEKKGCTLEKSSADSEIQQAENGKKKKKSKKAPSLEKKSSGGDNGSLEEEEVTIGLQPETQLPQENVDVAGDEGLQTIDEGKKRKKRKRALDSGGGFEEDFVTEEKAKKKKKRREGPLLGADERVEKEPDSKEESRKEKGKKEELDQDNDDLPVVEKKKKKKKKENRSAADWERETGLEEKERTGTDRVVEDGSGGLNEESGIRKKKRKDRQRGDALPIADDNPAREETSKAVKGKKTDGNLKGEEVTCDGLEEEERKKKRGKEGEKQRKNPKTSGNITEKVETVGETRKVEGDMNKNCDTYEGRKKTETVEGGEGVDGNGEEKKPDASDVSESANQAETPEDQQENNRGPEIYKTELLRKVSVKSNVSFQNKRNLFWFPNKVENFKGSNLASMKGYGMTKFTKADVA